MVITHAANIVGYVVRMLCLMTCLIFAAVPRPTHPNPKLLGTGGRLLTGKGKDMLLLSLRRIRPRASTSTCGMGMTMPTGRMAKSSGAAPSTIASPAKVGVYAGGVEMPFTSTLRIVDPDKLPVSETTAVCIESETEGRRPGQSDFTFAFTLSRKKCCILVENSSSTSMLSVFTTVYVRGEC